MKLYRSTVIDKTADEETTRYHKNLTLAKEHVFVASRDDDKKRISSIDGHVDMIELLGLPKDIILNALNRDMADAVVVRVWQLDGEVEKPKSKVQL